MKDWKEAQPINLTDGIKSGTTTPPDRSVEEAIKKVVASVTGDDGLLDIGKYDHELLYDLLAEIFGQGIEAGRREAEITIRNVIRTNPFWPSLNLEIAIDVALTSLHTLGIEAGRREALQKATLKVNEVTGHARGTHFDCMTCDILDALATLKHPNV